MRISTSYGALTLEAKWLVPAGTFPEDAARDPKSCLTSVTIDLHKHAIAHAARALRESGATPAQTKVGIRLAFGKPKPVIADELGIQLSSVESLTKKLYQTLDVRNSAELATKIWLDEEQDEAIWGINGIIWFNRQRQPGKARVAFDYRYGLALHAVHLGRDEEKEEASFQLGLILHNAVEWPMKYHVEDMSVIVGDRTIANPNFANLGGLISRGCYITFYYPPFAKSVERPRANGIIKFTIAYGHPDFGFSRRMKKTLNVSLRLDDKPGAMYVIECESDENF